MNKIKVSAIVVGRNESKKLIHCLKSLCFCDEILYADLDSSDNSVQIANNFGCRIFEYKVFGPSCEYAQSDLIKEVANDWVIMLDPDEVLTDSLMSELTEKLPEISLDKKIGDVYVPWQFFFGSKKLNGTVWGHNKEKGILVNRNRYEIRPITHYGRKLKDGYISYHIKNNGFNVLNHYWMDDMKSFIAKHKKYLKDEGIDRYNTGQRISFLGIIYNVFYQFIRCYFITRGYRDGLIGIFLSVFWTWYITYSNCSLYRITLSSKKNVKY